MKSLQIGFIVLLSFISFCCHSGVYSQEGNVAGMFSGKGNVVGIFHSSSWFNPAGCPSGEPDKAYLIEYTSTDDWNKVYSMLLAAYLSNTKIKIGVNPAQCFAGYPVIERVAFVKGY